MIANNLRPLLLSEIIGQEKVVKSLQGYINNNTIPSVLYFIGSSGSGKTSLSYIMAALLACQNPIKDIHGNLIPCNHCDNCLDIINDTFQKDVKMYNGGFLDTEGIKKLEEDLNFSPLFSKNKIFIISEAQQVRELRRLLEIIERKTKNVYFIFTSTDKEKFQNLGKSENKFSESAAFRSRGAYFNLKPVPISLVSEYLFDITNKFDTAHKVPESFYEKGLFTIAENSMGNVRQAINDLWTALSGEIYEPKEIIDILGYMDNDELIDILFKLLQKDIKAISLLQETKDLKGFFYYAWTILTDTALRDITKKPFIQEWKEKGALKLLGTNQVVNLLSVFEETNKSLYGYFQEAVFLSKIYDYYKVPVGVKKVKKPV